MDSSSFRLEVRACPQAKVGQLVDLHNQANINLSSRLLGRALRLVPSPSFKRKVAVVLFQASQESRAAIIDFDDHRHSIVHIAGFDSAKDRIVSRAVGEFLHHGFDFLPNQPSDPIRDEISGHMILFGKRLDFFLHNSIGAIGSSLGERVAWLSTHRKYLISTRFQNLLLRKGSFEALWEFVERRNAIAHDVHPRDVKVMGESAKSVFQVIRVLRHCSLTDSEKLELVLKNEKLEKKMRITATLQSAAIATPWLRTGFAITNEILFAQWNKYWDTFENSNLYMINWGGYDEVEKEVFRRVVEDSSMWQSLQGFEPPLLSSFRTGEFSVWVRMAMLVELFETAERGAEFVSYELRNDSALAERRRERENLVQRWVRVIYGFVVFAVVLVYYFCYLMDERGWSVVRKEEFQRKLCANPFEGF